jgi:hypothetical protein
MTWKAPRGSRVLRHGRSREHNRERSSQQQRSDGPGPTLLGTQLAIMPYRHETDFWQMPC